jgi:hypothetical protein
MPIIVKEKGVKAIPNIPSYRKATLNQTNVMRVKALNFIRR